MSLRRLSLALCLLGVPLRTEALPLEAKIGVLGVPALSVGGAAEVGLPGTPLTLGGEASMHFGSAGLVAGWGEYTQALSPESSVGLLLGANLDWLPRRCPLPTRWSTSLWGGCWPAFVAYGRYALSPQA